MLNLFDTVYMYFFLYFRLPLIRTELKVGIRIQSNPNNHYSNSVFRQRNSFNMYEN